MVKLSLTILLAIFLIVGLTVGFFFAWSNSKSLSQLKAKDEYSIPRMLREVKTMSEAIILIVCLKKELCLSKSISTHLCSHSVLGASLAAAEKQKHRAAYKTWIDQDQPKQYFYLSDKEFRDIERKAKKAGINTYTTFSPLSTELEKRDKAVIAIGPDSYDKLKDAFPNISLINPLK
ncbi:Peptidyl-tRNA hydrolase, PTH2 like protein [Aduncisulcus paluster]|uniref:peptidyl-tRNA hydrolase n=1 Tax=Aduncisulcus paluster TaxID=2918883 RepID=A0ABQ5KV70_9EUKA|nr:Peptidyl-tRNA hydrolase, PTH2 like protein [Aduncisulcus paluster]